MEGDVDRALRGTVVADLRVHRIGRIDERPARLREVAAEPPGHDRLDRREEARKDRLDRQRRLAVVAVREAFPQPDRRVGRVAVRAVTDLDDHRAGDLVERAGDPEGVAEGEVDRLAVQCQSHVMLPL